MSAQRTAPAPPPPADRRRRPVAPLVAVVVVLALAAVAAWWFLLRDDAPEAANIEDATSAIATGAPADVDSLDGTWAVDPTVGSDAGQGSFAGFRVDEELAQGIGHKTVVARTARVEGEVVIADGVMEATDITVDVTTLATDDSRRDGKLKEAIAATQFPTGTFALTEPIHIGEVTEGETVQTTATGDLTVKGVTAPVTVDISAELNGDVVTVVGSGPIVFADHQVVPPSAPIVVAVEDHGVLELQLHLRRA